MPDPAAEPDIADPRARAGRQKWVLLIILLALLVLSVIPIRMASHLRLERELRAIADRGEPTRWEDILPAPSEIPPPAENAAEIYRQAFARVDTSGGDSDQALLPLVGEKYEQPANHEPLGDEVIDAATRLLEKNADALRLLSEADAMEKCHFGTQITPDRDVQFLDTLDKFLKCAELRALQAIAAAERGDGNEAVDAMIGVFRLAQRLDGEPSFVIHRLVSVAMRALTVHHAERVMNRLELSEAQLARLYAALPVTDADAMRRCFVVERIGGIELFPQSFRPGSPGSYVFDDTAKDKAIAVGYRVFGLDALDELAYLRYMEDLAEAAAKPLPDRIAETRRVEADLEASFTGMRKLYTRATQTLAPALGRAAQLEAREFADVEIARAALAAERFRLAEGRWPDSLEEVVPRFLAALPADPFTGKPLVYKKLDAGFIVYSVGEDATDNGGAKTNPAGDQYEPGSDIPFQVTRLAPATAPLE